MDVTQGSNPPHPDTPSTDAVRLAHSGPERNSHATAAILSRHHHAFQNHLPARVEPRLSIRNQRQVAKDRQLRIQFRMELMGWKLIGHVHRFERGHFGTA